VNVIVEAMVSAIAAQSLPAAMAQVIHARLSVKHLDDALLFINGNAQKASLTMARKSIT
jgi:3-methyladenine DNA glycosylase/8-oxoguanine DNA glycosylase